MIMNIFIILMWVLIGILNSVDFDSKSVIIWLATIVIIINQISFIGLQ